MVNAQEWLEIQEKYNLKEKRAKIKKINISNQDLEGELDLTEFSQLKKLKCYGNKITVLNINKCSELKKLNCSDNQLTNLDLSNCRKISDLSCAINQFTNLDLEECTQLTKLECCRDQLKNKDLDLSKFPQLSEDKIIWTYNAQEWLDKNYPKDGVCLVESVNNSIGNILLSDFKTNLQCPTNGAINGNFLHPQTDSQIDKLPVQNKSEKWNNKGKTRVEITKLSLKNLENSLQLVNFAQLQELDCSSNYLTQLEITNCPRLEKINCENNNLFKLNLCGCSNLKELSCGRNKLTSTKFLQLVPNPKKLERLFINGNNDNLFAEPKLSSLLSLRLNLTSSKLPFPIPLVPDLNSLLNSLLSLTLALVNLKENVPNNKKLKGELNLGDFVNLEELNCSDNKLTKLNISNSLNLKELVCNDNNLVDILFPVDSEKLVLERINITNNKELDYATIENRFLKSLPVLSQSEIIAIDKEELNQIIQKRLNIYGEIKDIYYFSTWWNPNCALVVNKVVWYAIRLVVYEPLTKEQKNRKIELEDQLKVAQQELVIEKNKTMSFLNIDITNLKQRTTEKRKKMEQVDSCQKRIERLEVAIKKIEMGKIFKVVKVSEHIYKDKVYRKVEELKEKLNNDNPILAIYSDSSSGFSPDKVIKRIKLPKEVIEDPDKYLKPGDLVWRAMEVGQKIVNNPMVRNIIDIIKAVDTSGLFSVIEKLFEILSYMDVDCYHVAIYLGNKKVVHIGSSKFVKSSKIKDNKSLLGARTDNWVDFLHGTDKLIRYHPIIPFQRPSKIQKHITKSVLAKYGAESYSFLGNNCEHFATLVVCGIPFSIQADKISLSVHKFHWDLAKEMLKNKQEFAKMSNSEKFAEELTKNKEQHVKEINNLKTKTELYEEEQYQLIQLTKLEAELENLEKLIKKLQDQTNINDTNSEIELRSISHYGRTASSLSSVSSTSPFNWDQIITKKNSIHGTIEKIIPLENNQALVINKVFLYALRLFEYKDNKLTELERYAKNKVGYPTLESALAKAERIIADLNQTKTITQIQIPTK